jgi:hypothetical protein
MFATTFALMPFIYLITGLSGTPGLEICSHPLSPMVFLKLKKPTGSLAADLDLLETIAEQVSWIWLDKDLLTKFT